MGKGTFFVNPVGEHGNSLGDGIIIYGGYLSPSEQENLAGKICNFLNDYETEKQKLLQKTELK